MFSTTTNTTTAQLQLRVAPTEEPQIRRPCARCKRSQVFICSGKFRVNANGKTIDVWLIYRCGACDQTWNHPIHERRAVKSLAAAELTAFMQNDAALVRRHAHDLDRLRAAGAEVATASQAMIERVVLQPATEETQVIVISIVLTAACRVRLDRVLSAGLSLQRREVAVLLTQSVLEMQPPTAKALQRAAMDGQWIRLDLSRCAEPLAALCRQTAAAGLPGAGAAGTPVTLVVDPDITVS